QCDAIVDTMRNTPFMDINDSESETHSAGYQAIDRGQRVLRLLADFIDVIEIDDVRIRAAIADSFATITELADGLVLSDNLSFREAHEIASDVAKASIAARRSLDELSFDQFKAIYEARVGRSPTIDAEGLRRFVSPEHFIAVRDRRGGPAEASLHASLELYRNDLQSQRNDLAAAVTRRDNAAARLDQTIRSLLHDQAA
ncbi:MAG: argininosuccinate lyase, partial [Geminicoccaceae bacterium]